MKAFKRAIASLREEPPRRCADDEGNRPPITLCKCAAINSSIEIESPDKTKGLPEADTEAAEEPDAAAGAGELDALPDTLAG